ncbi:MAG TPA: SH3 domain-containing protein [Roseiflexaceae bacterium]|nr:SH3 domain-containing protein [Roseiflexaceae bacterium]
MSPLFGGGNKDKDKEIAKDMENLSQQIGALSRQLAERNKEVSDLQNQLDAAKGAQTNAQSKQTQQGQQLQQAQSQNAALQKQIAQLQQQLEQLKQQQQEAAAAAPAASSTVSTASAPTTATGGLQAGNTAYVTRAGGLPLRLRSGPGLNNSIIDRLPPGTALTLLGGPQEADGHSWWNVRTSNNQTGWVAGENLRTQPD